jgi:hypothetical protein
MPSYHVSVPHALGLATARARLDVFLEDVRRQYAAYLGDVSGAWNADCLDFRFHAAGLPISGKLAVEETSVQVSGHLPLAAALFRGRIERTIREELTKLLS